LANEGEKVCWWVGSGSWWREEMVKLVVVTCYSAAMDVFIDELL